MGPAIIFDKSVIESLTPDEAVWLAHFYLSVLTPTFYAETLADLEKEPRGGRSAAQIVGNIAYKVPDFSSKTNVLFSTMIEGELFAGQKVLMDGRPVVGGGRTVMLEGGTGTFFEASPEEEAFMRWQKHEYQELERLYAKKWRLMLSNLDLQRNYEFFQRFFPTGKPTTLQDIKKFVDLYLETPNQEDVFTFGMALMGINPEYFSAIISKWKKAGKERIAVYAPYFYFVVSLDLFFNLGIASDLIGRGRASHKLDLSYLYYLPCCKVFTSNDKLHQQLAPLFLTKDQTFVLGTDLKEDLNKIDQHFDKFPNEVKARGITSFAFFPPSTGDFLTSSLWDRYMSKQWRKRADELVTYPKPSVPSGLADHIKKIEDGRPLTEEEWSNFSSDNNHQMVIKRRVSGKRGKWERFPPELRNQKNSS